MTFSNTVAQQREKQAKSLKQFVMVCFAGSVALHGGGLFLKINNLWNSDEPPSEEITIVVTEDEPEIAAAPETPVSEQSAASQFSATSAATFSEPTVVDAPAPTDPLEPNEEEPNEEAPVAEAEPTSTEEAISQEIAEDSTEELTEASAPGESNSRNFSNLLAELRRARQQPGSSMAAAPTQPDGNSSAGTAGTPGNGVAAAPTQPGSGITPASPAPSRQERRSREITCRGCNFDYPDSADGAEGTAQVIVETDAQGRVVSVMLSRSSGNAALDRAALEQARRRVRLNNARAGESYPIDVDFVQPNSEAAERVRERGDRRSITVSDPALEAAEAPETPPVTETETPPSSPVGREPQLEPSATPLPSPSEVDSSAPEPESSTSSEAEPSPPETEPSISPQPAQNAPTTPIPKPPTAVETAPRPVPELPPAPLTQTEPTQSPEPRLVEP